jgi:hypothetical protein
MSDARERELTRSLARLAEQDAGREAPARVEQALLRELELARRARAARGQPGERRAGARWGWAAAAAVAAGLAAWAVATAPLRSGPEPGRSEPALAAQDAGFIPIRYAADLGEVDAVEIVRVRLPRSAAASLGWPEDVRLDAESVEADVIAGHDGVARAIRFAPPSRAADLSSTTGGEDR